MAFGKDEVVKAARLARLRVGREEEARLAFELAKIFSWIAQLNEVDTEGIAPLLDIGGAGGVMRCDHSGAVAPRPALLANAPSVRDGFFSVPRVVERK